ncbi:MAG: winged helix-turn-helix transcriptional regulator [Pseudomonadota bacterium]
MIANKLKKTVSGKRPKEPIHQLFDITGRRWALRVIWELRSGALGFRALREACGGASPTVLSTRLTDLRNARLVESENGAYTLTRSGAELAEALNGLNGVAGNLFGV